MSHQYKPSGKNLYASMGTETNGYVTLMAMTRTIILLPSQIGYPYVDFTVARSSTEYTVTWQGRDRVPGCHWNDVIMSAMASQITSLTTVYSTVYLWRRSKKTAKLRVTGFCAGNSPVTGEFPAQRDSDAENVSIWWRHYGYSSFCPPCDMPYWYVDVLKQWMGTIDHW